MAIFEAPVTGLLVLEPLNASNPIATLPDEVVKCSAAPRPTAVLVLPVD